MAAMYLNLPEPPPSRAGGRISRGAVIATIVVVMLAAVGIGAAFVLRGDEESMDAASEPTATPSASRVDSRSEPTSSAAPASPGYERYTSAEFGYTVEYPDSWHIDHQPEANADVQFFFFEDAFEFDQMATCYLELPACKSQVLIRGQLLRHDYLPPVAGQSLPKLIPLSVLRLVVVCEAMIKPA